MPANVLALFKSGDIVMFLVKELPDRKKLKKLLKDTKGADAGRALFVMEFIKSASDILVSIDKFFSSKDFSHGRFTVLTVLAETDGKSMFPNEIAMQMGVSRATASGLIKGLQASGYIESTPSETDGRMKSVRITTAGIDFLESLTPEYYKLICSFTGDMGKKELKQYTEIFSAVSASVAK